MDPQRGWIAAPVPRQGIGAALVVGRQAADVPRGRRAEGIADLRALCRRRRAGDANHPHHRDAAQRTLVARRQIDRLLDVRPRRGEVDDFDARRTEGGQMDARPAGGQHDPLPAGRRRLSRRRLHPPVRGSRRRWHRARADQGQVERRRGRAARRRVDRLDARQQVDCLRRQSVARRRHAISVVAALRRRRRDGRHSRAREQARQLGPPGRSRRMAARWPSPAILRPAVRTPSAICS